MGNGNELMQLSANCYNALAKDAAAAASPCKSIRGLRTVLGVFLDGYFRRQHKKATTSKQRVGG